MKTSNIILIAGLLVLMVSMAIGMNRAKSALKGSMIEPSGVIIEQTYDVSKFDKINLGNNIECTLKKADEQMVKVEMDEAFIENLTVKVSENGELDFDFDGFVSSEPTIVTIHYTDLSALIVRSASCSGEIISDSLTILKVKSGANLNARLQSNYCKLETTSGSEATLTGECNSLNTESKSGSEIAASDLKTNDCIAVVKSGSSAKLNVSRTLSATAESGGNISYSGSPEITGLTQKSGGTVTKMDE